MNFIRTAFGKTITELTYSDIELFFSQGQTETDYSEFKSYNENESFEKNIDKIHRSLCGFLNSGGGFIIWGAPVGVTVPSQQEKVFTGALKPISSIIGKDRMVNKLADKIIPLPNSFNAEVISDSTNTKSICVIEIEKSNYAPHQYSDNYWMRMDGQTRKAPHHYIETLFKQIRYPNIEGYLGILSITKVANGYKVRLVFTVINSSPLQNEHSVSLILTCSKNVKFMESKNNNKFYSRGVYCQYNNFATVLSYGELQPEFENIFISDEIVEKNETIDVKLSFVGHSSPRKESAYNINIPSNIRLRNNQMINNKDCSDFLKVESENVLFSETEIDGKVASKTNFLSVIGRQNNSK